MKNRPGPPSSRSAEKPAAANAPNNSKGQAEKPAPPGGAMREVVESIVVAFVLAFLFRTFEAEAFVIPTGSMAPTLMGRHRDAVCAKCGYRYQISASEEMDSSTNQPTQNSIVAGTCPMCRYTMAIGGQNPQDKNYPSYKGDRILVGKFPYQFREPERWEVTVFRFPGAANTNYIKRLIGLPNETVRIDHGDIFTRPLGQTEFTIQRKPSCKLLAMLRPVYNNDYVLPDLVKIGWPARWYAGPSPKAGQTGQWITDDLKGFRTDGSAPGETWLRYRHVVPSYDDWKWLADGKLPPNHSNPQPQLVTDFVGYNTQVAAPSSAAESMRTLPLIFEPDPKSLGLHWVGDVAVRCELNLTGNTGQIVLELLKGGVRFLCRLDAATGSAVLGIQGHPEFGQPQAQTLVRGPGSHRVMFANVDQQLRLWVDGRETQFDAPTTYAPLGNDLPTPEDREPVRIGSLQAAAEVNHLEVLRDIYYIAVDTRATLGSFGTAMTDYDQSPFLGKSADEVAEILSDPSQWSGFRSARSVQFDLVQDQFLMLGDNSAESRDSRLWPADGIEYYVRRDLLIGRALVIYWPHGWDIPGTDLPIKPIPNIPRMRLVR